ncbi:hypothetical protein Tco_0304685 [Tanacetum coccineum]
MRILSVIRVKAYSRYEYDYLSKIVLLRADFQEHTITEKDFKNLYPSNFEDLSLLLLQGHLDHLMKVRWHLSFLDLQDHNFRRDDCWELNASEVTILLYGDAPAVTSASTEGPIPPKTAEQKNKQKE